MFILKFDTLKIPINDFCLDDDLLVFDAKFDSKEDFEKFVAYYENHTEDKFSFDYSIDNAQYHGRFGSLVYDVDYNVRFYMLTTPYEGRNLGLNFDVLHYNMPYILQNHEMRINILIDILKQKSVLNEPDLERLQSYLPVNDYKIDLYRQVKNLQVYLETTESTMADLRNDVK